MLGIAGDGEVMDAYISTGAFDVLATSYHVNSPWQTRHRIRAALERDMAVMAYGYFPEELDTAKKAESVHVPTGRACSALAVDGPSMIRWPARAPSPSCTRPTAGAPSTSAWPSP